MWCSQCNTNGLVERKDRVKVCVVCGYTIRRPRSAGRKFRKELKKYRRFSDKQFGWQKAEEK